MKRWTGFILLVLLAMLAVVTSVGAQAGETYYVKSATVRVREEANTTSAIVERIRRNTAVTVLDVVEGTKVSGSTVWYHVQLVDGKEGYVHSSLLTSKAPKVASTVTPLPGQVSVATVVPTTAPVSVGSTSGVSCPDITATCSHLTCAQAYACLAAGHGGLDRDHDGVPCESVCSGG